MQPKRKVVARSHDRTRALVATVPSLDTGFMPWTYGERVIYQPTREVGPRAPIPGRVAGIEMHDSTKALQQDRVWLMVLGGEDATAMRLGLTRGTICAVARAQCTFGAEAIAFHVLLKMQGRVLDDV